MTPEQVADLVATLNARAQQGGRRVNVEREAALMIKSQQARIERLEGALREAEPHIRGAGSARASVVVRAALEAT